MKCNSIWLDNLEESKVKKLNEDIVVDVLIIGGGITGLSTAYHLKDSNLKVCLTERNLIGHGVTARTTAKLTYLQELIYSKLSNCFDEKTAKLYLNSQKDAINIVKNIIEENNIGCNFESVSSYVFTNDDKEIECINEEKRILRSFGIDVKEVKKLPNNTKCKKGISVNDTAVFHPLKYLYSLKNILSNKIDIYENTKINTVEKENDVYICKTDKNEIRAKNVVFAVHYPYFLIPYMFPLKAYLEKSYIAAFKVEKTFDFSAITSAKPTISIRYHKDNNKYQIYLSNSHNLCVKNNEKDNFDDLLSKIKEKPDFIWSNKDIITSDSLPYIGKLKDNMFIGTGYNTWGMTNGTIAGSILADQILNKENKYGELFSPHRELNPQKILTFPIILSSNIKSYIGSKISKNKYWYKNVVFKKIDGENVAIYTDENKKEHIVYNRCPHLKCGLIFNEVECTWDCPCHGSRFDVDGKCIEGPSNYDICYKKE